MAIVWDEPKRLSNIEKHGLDFADLERETDMSSLRVLDVKLDDQGRERFRIILLMTGIPVIVILSPLGSEGYSIISLRRASRKEIRTYVERTA